MVDFNPFNRTDDASDESNEDRLYSFESDGFGPMHDDIDFCVLTVKLAECNRSEDGPQVWVVGDQDFGCWRIPSAGWLAVHKETGICSTGDRPGSAASKALERMVELYTLALAAGKLDEYEHLPDVFTTEKPDKEGWQ